MKEDWVYFHNLLLFFIVSSHLVGLLTTYCLSKSSLIFGKWHYRSSCELHLVQNYLKAGIRWESAIFRRQCWQLNLDSGICILLFEMSKKFKHGLQSDNMEIFSVNLKVCNTLKSTMDRQAALNNKNIQIATELCPCLTTRAWKTFITYTVYCSFLTQGAHIQIRRTHGRINSNIMFLLTASLKRCITCQV